MTDQTRNIFYYHHLNHPIYLEMIGKRPEVRVDRIDADTPADRTTQILAQAHAYQIGSDQNEMPADFQACDALFRRAPRLLMVSTHGAGYDTIDLDACTRAGIIAMNQAGGNAEAVGEHTAEYGVGPRRRPVWLVPSDLERVRGWETQGFTEALRTPDSTLIFVTPARAEAILRDQVDCMGCLSACMFSNWAQNEEGTTGKKADPRSFCIQKTLQDIAHTSDVDTQLMFAGHNAYRFSEAPFSANGFIPTVKQLFERIMTGR